MTTKFEVGRRNDQARAWAERRAKALGLPRVNSGWNWIQFLPRPFEDGPTLTLHEGGSPLVVHRDHSSLVVTVKRF
jgi:hypothetical protein